MLTKRLTDLKNTVLTFSEMPPTTRNVASSRYSCENDIFIYIQLVVSAGYTLIPLKIFKDLTHSKQNFFTNILSNTIVN